MDTCLAAFHKSILLLSRLLTQEPKRSADKNAACAIHGLLAIASEHPSNARVGTLGDQ